MIWTDGRIIAPGQLVVSTQDRTFEHGLGLFETFRTWNGRAVLLDRHLDRLRRSAAELRIPLDEASLPDRAAVDQLLRATGLADALLRLTTSAGRSPGPRPTMWLTAAPLPPDPPRSGYRVVDAPGTVAVGDRLARHKTLNYWAKRLAFEQAQSLGADEAIITSADGRIWEASRGNLFLIVGDRLITPPESGPIIPGIMRRLVLDLAGPAGWATTEAEITRATVAEADEVFLTNSVRGLIPVSRWDGREGPPLGRPLGGTHQLRQSVLEHLTPDRIPIDRDRAGNGDSPAAALAGTVPVSSPIPHQRGSL